ncbi:hypothetical protein [Pseudomonas sp. DSP3-2-2]|uniref:hypothetical protein n=1 Tax=unclassified Pseudomonas TaxID=196821 RepID=UPI003CE9BB6B
MSRSLYQVACTGLDDLYSVQNGFDNLRAIFTLMLRTFPEDHTANAFAQLGILEVEDWSSMVDQWADCMDNELDAFAAERQAYLVKIRRRVALQIGAAK